MADAEQSGGEYCPDVDFWIEGAEQALEWARVKAELWGVDAVGPHTCRYPLSFYHPANIREHVLDHPWAAHPLYGGCGEPGLVVLTEFTMEAVRAAVHDAWSSGMLSNLLPVGHEWHTMERYPSVRTPRYVPSGEVLGAPSVDHVLVTSAVSERERSGHSGWLCGPFVVFPDGTRFTVTLATPDAIDQRMGASASTHLVAIGLLPVRGIDRTSLDLAVAQAHVRDLFCYLRPIRPQ